MKKLIIKASLLLIVAIIASNYMLYVTTGKLPFDKDSFSVPTVSLSAPKKLLKDLNPIKGDDEQNSQVYKWTDENGVVQYTAEPPPEYVQAKTLNIDPNVNVVQSIKVPEPETEEKTTDSASTQGSVYNPQSVKKLMDDTKNVQNLLDERFKKQQESLKGL